MQPLAEKHRIPSVPHSRRPHTTSTRIRWLLVGALGCLLAGCAIVGPPSIRNGRAVYNDAINDTNNQQLLMVIIRARYSETASLLAVNNVTANVSVSTSTGIQFGFGNESNYAGNLVPFSASAVYEENPTISYAPVEGQKYLRQLTRPVSLSILMPLCEAVVYPAPLLTALIDRVNGLANPAFISSQTAADPRFARFVELVSELAQADVLNWIEDPQQRGRFSAVIHHFRPEREDDVKELLQLLGLSVPMTDASEIVIPVSTGIGGGGSEGIVFTTRSVYNLVEILSAAVDIPGEDLTTGAAIGYPAANSPGKHLHVLRARDKPDNAYVAVKHHGWWYYIDETDQPTKQFFLLVTVLWSVTIAESTAGSQKAPILMLPASH